MQDTLLKNIEAQAKAELAQFKQARKANDGKPPVAKPVDVYQEKANSRRAFAKKSFPRGSSTMVMAVVRDIVGQQGGLRKAYNQAKSDSEYYRKKGEADKADIVRQQYMEERFIPAIEATVNYTTPDEVLNCKDALAELDKLSLGIGDGQRGYTASYIRQSYGPLLGQVENVKSDAAVANAVAKITSLANRDMVRTAVGMAQKAIEQIENGEHLASEEDYALLKRVANA